jgi:hypothetical protein
MPLPMVHLAVAVAICDAADAEPVPEFLLGTLAPDAIHMRAGTAREAKARVHLHRAIEACGFEAVHELYDQLMAQEDQLRDLALGYAVHLLTDALWVERLFLPFRAATHLPRDEERALYYRDTDEVDRLLYERAPWRADVWRALAAAQPADLPGLLSADEIGRWRDRTLSWFDRLAPSPEPPKFFTCERVQAFVAEAAAGIMAEVAAWDSLQRQLPGV